MKAPALLSLVFPIIFILSLRSSAADSIPLGRARPGIVSHRADPAKCSQYTAAAQRAIDSLPSVPKDHRWIVVCSHETWNVAVRKAKAWGRTNTAFTNPEANITFINGAVFEEPEPFYRHVIAHELGHIRCQCSDELAANAAAHNIEDSTPGTEQPTVGQP